LGKKLYVGNLPFSSTEDDIRSAFEQHGTVASVNVIMDRETGRPRGFAFVEMEDQNGAEAAIRALDGRDFGGRTIKVSEAQDRRGGGGGGGGGGGYGGGRGGGGGGYGGGGGGGRGRY
jgi:cold-inducible RNA-binding protein